MARRVVMQMTSTADGKCVWAIGPSDHPSKVQVVPGWVRITIELPRQTMLDTIAMLGEMVAYLDHEPGTDEAAGGSTDSTEAGLRGDTLHVIPIATDDTTSRGEPQ